MDVKDIIKNKRLQRGLTMKDVATCVGVSESTISRWESGEIASMKHSHIVALANILQISPATIMGWESGPDDDTDQHYYLNPETQKIGQEIYENKDLRLLFDAARNASPEDLKTVHDVLKALKAKEQGDYD